MKRRMRKFSSWSCRDDKELCQTACCTCELVVLPVAYQTYSGFSDVLVAVAVGLAKAPHWWPLNWAPFQINIVWNAFSIKKHVLPLNLKKKKKTGVTLPLCEQTLLLSSSWLRGKGGSARIASNLWGRRSPNFWTSQSCFFLSSNWFFIRVLERLSITFMPNGKREFVPRD